MSPVSYSQGYLMVLVRCIDLLIAGWIWRDYGVTISAFTGLELRKPAPKRWARALGWCLDHIQIGHCESAIAADIERAHTAILILRGEQQP